MGNDRLALSVYRQCHEGRLQVLGAAHPNTITAMADVATQHERLGEFEEAQLFREGVLRGRRQKMAEGGGRDVELQLCQALQWLGVLLLQGSKDYPAALRHLAEGLAARRRVLGANHEDTLAAAHHTATCHSKMGNLQQAEELMSEIVTAQRRTLGGEHKETLRSMNNLAVLCMDAQAPLAKQEAAVGLLREVALARRKTLGEADTNTKAVVVDLQIALQRATGSTNECPMANMLWGPFAEHVQRHPDREGLAVQKWLIAGTWSVFNWGLVEALDLPERQRQQRQLESAGSRSEEERIRCEQELAGANTILAGQRRASNAMRAAPAPAPAPAPPGERGAYDGGGLGLSVGDEVEIHGLKSAPEHNGKHAHVMKFVRKTGRYKVAVRGIVRSDSSGNYEQSTRWNGDTVKLAVRAVNLRPAAP